MNAIYFYNRLLGYEEESRKTGKHYYGYSNGNVTIHHKGDKRNWFVIFKDGSVLKESAENARTVELHVQDLEGDDFELFNIVQIIKSGYLVLDTISEREVKEVISKLYGCVESHENEDKDGPSICGAIMWYQGLTDRFHYFDINVIELELNTVKNLCKENVSRKYYDLHCIPFDKNMKNESAIHVRFINNMWGSDYAETRTECEEALDHLLGYMNEIGVRCKWADSMLRKPVYY